MGWTINPIMEWSEDGGTTWVKVTDHGRTPLSVSVERIENKRRMADGTLRRYVVAKKKSFTWSWENIPDKTTSFLANGTTHGQWIDDFHDRVNGSFLVRFREGSERDLTLTGLNGTVLEVMVADYSRETTKRGVEFDLWNIDMTIEEV